jgi:hypothetical protein
MDGYGAQSGTYNIHTCGDGSIDVKKWLKSLEIKGLKDW